MDGSPTLQRIRNEAGWDPFDSEPTDFDRLETYIRLLEAQVRAGDMLSGAFREERSDA